MSDFLNLTNSSHLRLNPLQSLIAELKTSFARPVFVFAPFGALNLRFLGYLPFKGEVLAAFINAYAIYLYHCPRSFILANGELLRRPNARFNLKIRAADDALILKPNKITKSLSKDTRLLA